MLFDMQIYDIRKKSGDLSYDFTKMETFLNLKTVKEALGVGDLLVVFCNDIVHTAMMDDWMKNLEVGIPALLEDGIKLLVYAGEYDLICNWLGKLNVLVLSHGFGREETKIWPKVIRVRI
jgi:serine carboxypeptidase-like clade 4